MELRELKSNGREILIAYTCRRCGGQALHPLEDMLTKDHYGYLHNTLLPKGWGEVNHSLLCPSCISAFRSFMNPNESKEAIH